MTDDIKTSIRRELLKHLNGWIDNGTEKCHCECGHHGTWGEWHSDHVAERIVALLTIPDRTHTDDLGRHWEWCGGGEGTWAWRITKLDTKIILDQLLAWVRDKHESG